MLLPSLFLDFSTLKKNRKLDILEKVVSALPTLAAFTVVIGAAYQTYQWLFSSNSSQSTSSHPTSSERQPVKPKPKFTPLQLEAGLAKAIAQTEFTVFLCGPSLQSTRDKEAAELRKRIQEELEFHQFTVYLGEDDGVDKLRKMYMLDAHQNELLFIENVANAVILIGASVGSFCELGLFSYKFESEYHANTDFILVLDESFKTDNSYLNFGPSAAVAKKGEVIHGNFSDFNTTPIIEMLRNRRATLASGV